MVTWPGQAGVVMRKAEPGNIFTKCQIECKPELTVLGGKDENIFYSCTVQLVHCTMYTHVQFSIFASYVKTQKEASWR